MGRKRKSVYPVGVREEFGTPVWRVELVKERELPIRQQLTGSGAVSRMLRDFLGAVDRECFVVACLDVRNRLIGVNLVAVGSLTAAIVHPREVLKPAILSNAHGIITAHNHPSGDPRPSTEDAALRHRLSLAAQALGVRYLDDIILGDGIHYSAADVGAMA
ncbi:MAG: JAB domain-containing protein [Deferrisomatales bacterium]